jgi:hypothetical protein
MDQLWQLGGIISVTGGDNEADLLVSRRIGTIPERFGFPISIKEQAAW